MKKIELIKKTNFDGVIYYVEIDGAYITGSCETDYDKAIQKYEAIKKDFTTGPMVEILKSETI